MLSSEELKVGGLYRFNVKPDEEEWCLYTDKDQFDYTELKNNDWLIYFGEIDGLYHRLVMFLTNHGILYEDIEVFYNHCLKDLTVMDET